MRYQNQFLDRSSNVIRELFADARSAAAAIALFVDMDWPPHAVSIRVLDGEGREVHSVLKGDGG